MLYSFRKLAPIKAITIFFNELPNSLVDVTPNHLRELECEEFSYIENSDSISKNIGPTYKNNDPISKKNDPIYKNDDSTSKNNYPTAKNENINSKIIMVITSTTVLQVLAMNTRGEQIVNKHAN